MNKAASHYIAAVKPLAPQTAPVPIGDRHVAPPPGRAQPQRYAQPDIFVAQVRPTLATLPSATATDLAPRSGGACPPRYGLPEAFCAPAKFNLLAVVIPVLPGWSPSGGIPSQPLEYDRGSFVAPDKLTAAATILSLAWRCEDPHIPKSDWYAMGDTLSGPATTAGTNEAFVSAVPGPKAREIHFASTTFSAPDKVGILPAAPPTISCWLPTLGGNAQPQLFDRGSFAVPDKAPSFAVAPPTIASWTSTLGVPAQPQEFDRGSITAPDKTLPAAAAAPSIAGWTSTLGVPAQPQEFDRGSITAPDKTLPMVAAAPSIAGWTSTLGAPAQPQDFDRGNFIGPDKVAPPALPTIESWTSTDARAAVRLPAWRTDAQTAPVLGLAASAAILKVRRFRAFSQLIALGGFTTFSSMEASKFAIISED